MIFRQPSNEIVHSQTKESKAVVKNRIVEAASRLFRKRGISGVSIGEISKEAKITVSGFYSCFASRDELLAVLIQRESQQCLKQMRCLNQFGDFFRGVEELFFRLTKENGRYFSPGLRIELFSYSSRSDIVAKQMADCKNALIDKLVQSLVLAQADGQVEPAVYPVSAASAIISATEGLMVNIHLPAELFEKQRSATLAFVRRGLMPR